MEPTPNSIPLPDNKRQGLYPEEKRIARALEELNILEPRDIFMLVLIWKNLKTASPVSLSPNAAKEEMRHFEEVIRESGMHFEPGPLLQEPMRGLRPGQIYFVANNAQDLEHISKLWWGDHEKDPNVYREIGQMSGFPATAIEAYDRLGALSGSEREEMIHTLFLSPEEKEKLIPKDLYPLSTLFYMTRENWQDELERVREWTEVIRTAVPQLWQKVSLESSK